MGGLVDHAARAQGADPGLRRLRVRACRAPLHVLRPGAGASRTRASSSLPSTRRRMLRSPTPRGTWTRCSRSANRCPSSRPCSRSCSRQAASAAILFKNWHDRTRSAKEVLPEVYGGVSRSRSCRSMRCMPPPLPGAGNYDVEMVLERRARRSRWRTMPASSAAGRAFEAASSCSRIRTSRSTCRRCAFPSSASG